MDYTVSGSVAVRVVTPENNLVNKHRALPRRPDEPRRFDQGRTITSD